MGFLKHLFKLWLIAILFNLIMAFIIEKESNSHQFIELKQMTNRNGHPINSSVDLMNENIENKNSDDKINDLYPNDDYYYDSLNEDAQNNNNQNLNVFTSTPYNIRENYKQILKDYKEMLEFKRKNAKSLSNTINFNENESYDYEEANNTETLEDYFHELFENPDDQLPQQQHIQLREKEKNNRKEVQKTTQQHPSNRKNESVKGDQTTNNHVGTNKIIINYENMNSHKKEAKLVEQSNLFITIGCLVLIAIFILFIAAFVFIFKRNKNSPKKKSHSNSCQANYTTVNQNEV
jgi:hypothetical protein